MSHQLREWLHRHTDSERTQLAESARTSVAYLWQLAGGHRKASVGLISRLSAASNHELTLEGLRPDLHQLLNQPKRRRKAA
ncbi:hypothetical protein JQR85_13665 [Stutzerimonas urumqiensis]|uniref:hypothetical protein n=1 Tax=Stutzerimonas urumqiensis TaxID=638269 RepID=UPI003DA690F6